MPTFFITATARDSGNAHRFRALARELAQRGHRVSLLVDSRRYRKMIDDTLIGRTAVRPYDETLDNNVEVLKWKPTSWDGARVLRKWISQRRPDCLIASFEAVNVAMAVGALMRVRYRIAWHRTLSSQLTLDLPKTSWKIRYLLGRKRFFYALATHLLTLSKAGQDNLVNTFGASPDKIAVFPNGLDDPLKTDPLHSASVTAAEKVSGRVVCVGRLSRSKGQDVLIRAVALLKDDPDLPDLHAVLVGDGGARREYMQLAESLGVADRIAFTGAVFHDVALSILASGMISVVPSRHEALGNVNLESLALGVPLIASDVDGIRDIVRDEEIGLLVASDDADSLAQGIRSVLLDSGRRDQLSKQGRAHYLAHYTLAAQTSRLADWLEKLTKKHT